MPALSLAALLLGACETPPSEAEQARQLAAALELAAADPEAAAAACLTLPEGPNRGSCAWGVAEAIGADAPATASAICQELSGFRKDECFFALARAAQDVTLCERAGAYAVDCERNVFVHDLEDWLSAPLRPGALEPEVLAGLERFQVDELRDALWEDVYTAALLVERHPSQTQCAPVEQPELREVCLRVARRIMRVNVDLAVSRGALYCEGERPHSLRGYEDALVDTLIAEAREAGRCREGATPERKATKRPKPGRD